MNNIKAFFENGKDVLFSANMIEMLKTDPEVIYIIDAITGELLYMR